MCDLIFEKTKTKQKHLIPDSIVLMLQCSIKLKDEVLEFNILFKHGNMNLGTIIEVIDMSKCKNVVSIQTTPYKHE